MSEWPTIHSEQREHPKNAGAFLPNCWWEGLFSPVACSVLLLDAIMSETLPFVIREREPF
jgi:hypothetical protein